MEQNKKKQLKINTSVILLVYIVIVIFAKIIRHTVLKATLVDMSAGNGMIYSINRGVAQFTFNIGGDAVANNTANVVFQMFRFLGLSTTIDYEILITLLWNILFIGILLKLKSKVSILEFSFLCMSLAVLNIWDFCLSKEPIQMLYFILIFYILISKKIKNKNKFGLSLLVFLLSAVTFRFYYILVLLFSICAYFVFTKFIINTKKVGFKDILKVIIFFGIVYFSMLIVSKAIAPEYYEQFMYFSTTGNSVAKTNMYGLFNSRNLIIVTLDYLILIIRMLFPVELIRFGLSYAIYALYQIFLTILIIRSFMKIKTNTYITNIALFLFIGFLFTSATFEPDFGSWVRHEAVALPVILVAADLHKEKIENSRKENYNVKIYN